jgi:hypothetical protein
MASPSSPPVLPNGKKVNAKNTLQSFATRSAPHLLPNGELIDAKNTAGPVAPAGPSDSDKPPPPQPQEEELVFPVPPVPRPDPPEDIPVVDPPSDPPPVKQWNRLVWLLAVVLIVGAVIGGVCVSSGNCSSGGEQGDEPTLSNPSAMMGGNNSMNVTSATIAPTNEPTTDAPAIAPPPAAPTIGPTNEPTTDAPTSAPTQPTSVRAERAAAITAFINTFTFSPVPLVYSLNPDVAATNGEGLALQWLIDKDPAQLSSSETFRLQQRYALATLFFQQNVSQSSWTNVTGWLTNSSECLWFGIVCSTESAVTDIALFSNNLRGTIPADIGLLTSLTIFSVWSNALTGALPSSIGQWTSLTDFSVFNNDLTGTLPSSIGQWTLLTFFEVDFNDVTGTLPSSIGQWTLLTFFDVGDNRLRGMIPNSVGNWTQIEDAYFYDNAFTGTMPSGICSASSLTILWADCDFEVVCTSCCTECF